MKHHIQRNVAPLARILILVAFLHTLIPPTLGVLTIWIPTAGLIAITAQAGVDAGDDRDGDGNADGEVIVKIKNQKKEKQVEKLADRYSMSVLEDLEDDVWLFGLPMSTSVEQAIALLSTDANVMWAEPNQILALPEVDQRGMIFVDQRGMVFVDGQSPSDYFDQYALSLIRATDALAMADGSGVTVALVDTGIDPGHPAFSGKLDVRSKSDYIDGDDDPSEEGTGPVFGHGTMLAGIIALMAPGAQVLPLRAFDSQGRGKSSKVSKAIRDAARHGAHVINMSFTVTVDNGPIRSAISFASERGTVLIAAAGNESSTVPRYPASDPAVTAVGATDPVDAKAAFSNYGSHLDVGAPGVSIYSTYPDGQFGWADGTSLSAAFVSGEAALLLSQGRANPVLLIKSATVPCCGGQLGEGRIDVLAAVSQ